MRRRRVRSWWNSWLRFGEDLLYQLFYALTLPFVLVGRWWRRFWYSLWRPRARGKAGGLLGVPLYILRFLLIELPVIACLEFVRFLRLIVGALFSWLPRAQVTDFLLGIPAILCAGVVIWPLVIPPKGNDASTELERQATQAYEREDYKWALLCFETLARENPDNPGFAFNVARVYEKQNQLERAYNMMLALAPPKRREGDPIGLPKAHLWLAMYMLKNPSLGPTEQADLETHLIRAATATTTDEETKLNAYALLGQLCLATAQNDLHRLSDAEKYFKLVTETKPELLIPLARVHILLAYTSSNNEATRRSNLEQARSDALRAEAYFRKRVNNDVDDVEALLNLAEAELFLEKSDDAIGLLKTGLKCVPTDSPDVARLMALLGRSHFLASELRYRNIEMKRPALNDPTRRDTAIAEMAVWEVERRDHLIQAFRSDPRHKPMVRRVMTGIRLGSPDYDFMVALVRRLAEDDSVPKSIVDVLMAVDNWNRRDAERAHVNLRDALTRDAQIPSLLIDMAKFYVELPPPEPQQSLDLLNMGLQAWADKPDLPYLANLYEERGVLCAKAGEFDRARSDLELALTMRPRDRRMAKVLITVYRQLGLTDRAERLNQEMQGFPLVAGR